MEQSNHNNILYEQIPFEPYPVDRLRRVEQPTTRITNTGQRIDLRDIAYGLAARGEYGPAVQKGVQKSLPGKYPLSAALKDIIDHISLIGNAPVALQEAPISHEPVVLTRHIKAAGYFLKADLMGACRVPESAYYSHDKQGNPIEPRYKNAIIIVMRKDLQAMQASSGRDWIGDPISFQAYQHLGLVAETLANYIRRLGWEASPQYGPSFVERYIVQLPPLLLAAGIGEVSRAGIILNPFFGLAFKAAAVLTDMPILPDQPIDFGLQSFCQNCTICAENCPSRAISTGDKVIYNGYETWKLDTRRCASFNFTNKNGTMCNRCVKSCPWSQPTTWPHNLVRTLVMNSSIAKTIAIRAAYLLKTGNGHPEDQWWFDMEYVDDVIISRESFKV
jgi:reductive dehalogenase